MSENAEKQAKEPEKPKTLADKIVDIVMVVIGLCAMASGVAILAGFAFTVWVDALK